MDLNELLVFARVVQSGSFTKAASVLGMPKSTVSRKVSDLEDRLDARLLQRTTRKLSLTDAGRTYFDHAQRIVGEIEDAERAVGNLQQKPRGLLRVTTGINTGYLGEPIASYLALYPEVRIELSCTARSVDLVEERFDVGIRAGALADSSLIARSLGSASWFFVASAAYLKKRGRPRAPDGLADHDCMLFDTGRTRVLRLSRGSKEVAITLSTRLLVGDMDILHRAAAAGLGIALLPAYQCIDDLRARRLERVMREWEAPATPIQIVYPSTRHLSPKVKTFVEHLQAAMTPPPWELGPMP